MSTPPFLVHVTNLRRTPSGRLSVAPSGPIDGLAVAGTVVPAGSDVTVDAVLELAGPSIVVTGAVSAAWSGECRRCLGPVTGELHVDVREIYEPPVRHRDPPPDGSLQADDTYPLAGDTLDLLPLARDAILLELPLAPLCRPDCAGLCPTCGADRNQARCECAGEQVNPAWAALDALRSPDSA